MITINTKKGDVKMSLNEFARWACLVEALLFISDKAKELNISALHLVKPNALDQYINERYHSVIADVRYEYNAGILK
jgi:hypothetical protein